MQKIVNGDFVEMTEEKIRQLEKEQAAFEAYEKKRPLTQAEVFQMMTKQTLNTLDIDDQTALRMVAYYPTWDELSAQGYTAEKSGFKFSHGEKLYKTKQENFTFQSQWVPGEGTESIFEVIDEEHAGTLEDPIPYDQNMTVYNGKYYSEDGIVYLCTRDSGQPLHASCASLVGNYFEVAA